MQKTKRFAAILWFPLCVRDGSHRRHVYQHLKVILPQFEEVTIQETTSIRIGQYLRWLRNQYRKPPGFS